jgi:hypothetical protein
VVDASCSIRNTNLQVREIFLKPSLHKFSCNIASESITLLALKNADWCHFSLGNYPPNFQVQRLEPIFITMHMMLRAWHVSHQTDKNYLWTVVKIWWINANRINKLFAITSHL